MEVSNDGGLTWEILATLSGTTTTFTGTGLTPGSSPIFTVTASNAGGNSTRGGTGDNSGSVPSGSPASGPSNPTSPASPPPTNIEGAPSYAVIDLGQNVYASQITDSGYILFPPTALPGSPVVGAVWHDGTTTTLHAPSGDYGANAIDEDGTVIGWGWDNTGTYGETETIDGTMAYTTGTYGGVISRRVAKWSPGSVTPTLTGTAQVDTFSSTYESSGTTVVRTRTYSEDEYGIGIANAYGITFTQRWLGFVPTPDPYKNGVELGHYSTGGWAASLIGYNNKGDAVYSDFSTAHSFLNGTPLDFVPSCVSSEVTIDGTTKTYVAGYNPDNSNKFTWWDGTDHVEPAGVGNLGVSINAHVVTITDSSGTQVTKPAIQIVGGFQIMQMDAVTGVLGGPQPIGNHAFNSDWTMIAAAPTSHALNDSGCIIGSGVFQPKDSNGQPTAPATYHEVLVAPAELVPDVNRDGVIDVTSGTSADRGKITKDNPYRFWINDSVEQGDVAHNDSDIPGEGDNFALDYVNGMEDMTNYFPVYVKIKNLLKLLPPDTFTYKIKQTDGAINVVLTDLKPEHAGDFLTGDLTGASGLLDNPKALSSANKLRVDPDDGAVLPTDWLNKILTDGQGVMLVDGRGQTTQPMVLSVSDSSGKEVTRIEMPLRINNLEKMYRWINLRRVAGQSESRPTDTSEPPNYPDKNTNGKMFIFIHGYNVSEDQSRAWMAEAFKRLYQAGSNAMFTGVSWHGDASKGAIPLLRDVAPDYWQNVDNAFLTSRALAQAVSGLKGSSKTIAAHSLGNMVVSSAIFDWGMSVSNYCMLDAAVAIEAFDSNSLSVSSMASPSWQYYDQRLWSPYWYQLFNANDGRNGLTWQNRFNEVSAVNFYSSGEDVLDNPNGGFPPPGTERAWVHQEMAKGTADLMTIAGGNIEGGWGFSTYWHETNVEANALSDDQIRAHPVFTEFSDSRLMDPQQGSSEAFKYLVRAKTLGDGIPALSFAVGRNQVGSFGLTRNFNLTTYEENGWPRNGKRWLHGDAKDVSYPYNHRLWETWVEIGGLK